MNNVEITEQTFEEEVYNSKMPVLLDFYSDSCIACERLDDVLKDITSIYKNKIKIARANIDTNRQLASICEIQCTPTIIIFENGTVVDILEGFKLSSILQEHINRII